MPKSEDESWTEEKCIELLREYKAKRLLWDTQHAFYYKKPKKVQAWKEIGEALGVGAAVCRHKMAVLLSSLRREKAKIMHSKIQIANGFSTGPEYKSRWFAFDEMGFILERETERKKRKAGVTEDEDSTRMDLGDGGEPTDPISQCWLSGSASASASGNQSDNEHMVEASSSKRAAIADSSRATGRSMEHTVDNDIEIESFTSFIAMKMKKYSERKKNSVQKAICDIIFEADRSCYNVGGNHSGDAVNEGDVIPIERYSFQLKQEQLDEDSI